MGRAAGAPSTEHGALHQHAAFAIGIWDPTLQVDTQATHGFIATGDPLVVTAAKGNRIEVTGNTARNVEVRCGPDGTRPTVNVNSVNVEAGALRGKTVIVTGRNTQDVRVQDCPKAPPGQLDGVNVNSVNIR